MSHLPILTFLLLLLLHLTCHRTEARHERRYPEPKRHGWHDKSDQHAADGAARHHRNHQRRHHHVTTTTTQSPYDAILGRLPRRDQDADLAWFFGKKPSNGHGGHRYRYEEDPDDSDEDDFDPFDEDYGFSTGRKYRPRTTTLTPKNLDLWDSDDDEYPDDEDIGDGTDEANPERNGHKTVGFSLTEYKWKNFGTRENVERQYLRQQQHYRRPYNHEVDRHHSERATAHLKLMSKALRCGVPLPRAINVRAEHPHASKSYLPRCTLLHRCGEDSGCCRDDEICAASKTQRVHLYFHSQSLGSATNVERLTFVNHTECACTDRRSVRTPDPDPDPDPDPTPDEVSRTESPVRHRAAAETPPNDGSARAAPQGLSRRSAGSDQDDEEDDSRLQKEQQDVLRRCRCPSQFSAHLLQDGGCQCDCFEGQKDCARIKRGKEYFGMMDRICIQRGDCRLPRCEFGAYKRQSGRCPRRQEKLEALGRYGTRSIVYD